MAETNSSNVWSGIQATLSAAAGAYSTIKQIDLEDDRQRLEDQNALLDRTAVQTNVGGVSFPTWVIIAAVVVIGGALAYRMIKR